MRITQTAISKKGPALFGSSPILDEDWDDLACPPTVLRSISNADFHGPRGAGTEYIPHVTADAVDTRFRQFPPLKLPHLRQWIEPRVYEVIPPSPQPFRMDELSARDCDKMWAPIDPVQRKAYLTMLANGPHEGLANTAKKLLEWSTA